MGAGHGTTGGRHQFRLGRVLVAHADDGWMADLGRWLSQAGFETTTCTPRAALVSFDRERPDLMVLAAHDGHEDAVAACQWIRNRSSVPILVAASRTARLDLVQLLTSGADLVLPTTVGERELVARVRALLRGRPPRQVTDPARAYGGLRLDRAAGVLHLNSGVLALEDRQLQLMELLLQTAPRVTSRATVREVLKVDDSTLDGLVRRLRERLEVAEGWRRIVAIRRVGFRLLAEAPAGHQPSTGATIPVRLADLPLAPLEVGGPPPSAADTTPTDGLALA
jgi:DNA-binding response OmpR family regulator